LVCISVVSYQGKPRHTFLSFWRHTCPEQGWGTNILYLGGSRQVHGQDHLGIVPHKIYKSIICQAEHNGPGRVLQMTVLNKPITPNLEYRKEGP